MRIEYLKGSKKEFFEFVDLITFRDKIAILTHNDLDGIASAVFLEKILEKKNLKIEYIDFLSINPNMIKEVIYTLEGKGITKVFFCDLGVDSIDFEGYVELRTKMDVFLIDHHPMSSNVYGFNKIIKTISEDCSALTVFDLGREVFDSSEWDWLLCSTLFSEFSYNKSENLEYIMKIYPEVSLENISSSVPGRIARKISSALVYYKMNVSYVYDLIKKRDLEELDRIHDIIEEEVDRIVEDFSDKKEFFPEEKVYFYEIDSKYELTSYVSSLISKIKPDYSFIFYRRTNGVMKISARNQGKNEDMGSLMQYACNGLEEASGGGHFPAAAARIKSEDFQKFKNRIMEYLNKNS